MNFQEKKRIKSTVYSIFRSGAKVPSADLYDNYKRGRIGAAQPGWDRPAALGAWLAGQDDAVDGIPDQRDTVTDKRSS